MNLRVLAPFCACLRDQWKIVLARLLILKDFLADPATLKEVRQSRHLRRQTCNDRSIESHSFFGRVANPATSDPPENKTAALTVISGGGKEDRKGGGRSCREIYRTGHDSATAGIADRLRELARAVRRIGGRDPEAIAIAKDDIAFALVGLARRVDGGRR
jgi:hypothetical protein